MTIEWFGFNFTIPSVSASRSSRRRWRIIRRRADGETFFTCVRMSKKTNAIVECWAVNHRLYIRGNEMNDDIVLSSTLPFSADSPRFIFLTARHVYSSLPTPIVLWLSPCVTSSCLIRSTSHLHSPRPTHDFDLRRACVKSRHLSSHRIWFRFDFRISPRGRAAKRRSD